MIVEPLNHLRRKGSISTITVQVIAISLIYMALKMTKLDNCDWVDRQPGEQWWDQFVANLTSDMMEDVSFLFGAFISKFIFMNTNYFLVAYLICFMFLLLRNSPKTITFVKQ